MYFHVLRFVAINHLQKSISVLGF